MNLVLWIVALLLAVVLLVAGISKLTIPKETLVAFPGGGWARSFSPNAIKGLGMLDILGSAGLVLPAAFGIAPILVPIAAVGVVLLMAGAVIARVHDHIPKAMVFDLTYLALAVFIAWGRFGPQSFTG
jgi:hypothetical protein